MHESLHSYGASEGQRVYGPVYSPSAPRKPPPNATAKMTSMRTIPAILLQKPYKPINWRNMMGPPLKARPAMLELCLDCRQSVSNSWPAHVGHPGKAQKRVRGGMPATRPVRGSAAAT